MTKTQNIAKKQNSGLTVLSSENDEYYGDYPWFKENILKWNKAQDIIGIKQTLWVLRIDMNFRGFLHEMDEHKWNVLLNKLRKKYHELVKRGKIDAVI